MNVLWSQQADTILSALLNGVLQGVVLCGVIWTLLGISRKLNASTRYLIWLSTLVAVCLLPCTHFLLARTGVGQDVQEDTPERSTPVHSPISAKLPHSTERAFHIRGSDLSGTPEALEQEHYSEITPKGEEAITPSFESEIPMETLFLADVFSGSSTETATETSSIPKEALSKQTNQTEIQHWLSAPSITFQTLWPPFLSLGILVVILLITLFKGSRLLLDLLLLRRLKNESTATTPKLEQWIVRLNFHEHGQRRVQVRVHETIKTPLALGFINPMILLPQSLVETMDEQKLSCILRHEWAHIVRYDDWTNFFQRLVEALFFFHPVVALIGRRLDIEREIACDDHVLADGSQAKAYALMLTQFANRERDRHLATATAGWNKKHQIKERIDMLLDHHRNTAPRPARVGAGLFTLAILAAAILAMNVSPRLALAQSESSLVSQNSSSADDLFEAPVAEPRSKDKKRSRVQGTTQNSADLEVSPRDSSIFMQGEPEATFESNGSDLLLTSPQGATLRAPGSPDAPSAINHPVEVQVPAELEEPVVVTSPPASGLPVQSQSPQRSTGTSRTSSSRSFPAANPFHFPNFPHEEQLAAKVEDALARAQGWQDWAEHQQASAQHLHNDSELERRIKALENLVHRLVQEKTTQSVRRRVPSLFNAIPEEESIPERSHRASNDPFASVDSDPEAVDQAKELAERAIRQARQDARLARQDALRGLEKLRKEQAKLEVERQRLTEQLQSLERREHSLQLRMTQEMAEIESSQTQGNAY